MSEIKRWQQRCEEHPDHNGIVTNQMIMDRMQEEIDDLRARVQYQDKMLAHHTAVEQGYKNVGMLVRAIGHLDGHEMVFRSKLCNGDWEAGHVAKQWAEQCSHPGVSYQLEIAQEYAYVITKEKT